MESVKKIIEDSKLRLIRIIENLARDFDVYKFYKFIKILYPYLPDEDALILSLMAEKILENLSERIFDQEDYWGE